MTRKQIKITDNKVVILADLHIHSTFSDGQMTIPEIVDFYGSRGFGAIAITDHICEKKTLIGKASKALDLSLTPGNFDIYKAILESEAKRADEQYGMILIPGFELSKNSVSNRRSAHIIGLGIKDFFWADDDAVVLSNKIREQGGIVVAAHPVFTRKNEKQTFYLWDNREELHSYFDAWEVASGNILFEEVLRSGLPMLANSDLHKRNQINSWKTLLDTEKHPEAILEAIKKQRVKFYFYRESDNV